LSCDSDAARVGSARSDWTRAVKVNRKTIRRKMRPYYTFLTVLFYLKHIKKNTLLFFALKYPSANMCYQSILRISR